MKYKSDWEERQEKHEQMKLKKRFVYRPRLERKIEEVARLHGREVPIQADRLEAQRIMWPEYLALFNY
jgi:hypothetical protein